jgi:hypothetical protein
MSQRRKEEHRSKLRKSSRKTDSKIVGIDQDAPYFTPQSTMGHGKYLINAI